MRYRASSQQRVIYDIDPANCSSDKVTRYDFIREKDFLYKFLPQMDQYQQQKQEIASLKSSLPPDLYLKQLQTFKSKLVDDLTLLKKSFSPKLIEKYTTKEEHEEAEKKKLLNNRKREIQMKQLKKLNNQLQGDFGFIKGQIESDQIGKEPLEGYFDKKLFSTQIAVGSKCFQTDYGSLEVVSKYKTKQSEIFMKLSEILQLPNFSQLLYYCINNNEKTSKNYNDQLKENCIAKDDSINRFRVWIKDSKKTLGELEKKFKKKYKKYKKKKKK